MSVIDTIRPVTENFCFDGALTDVCELTAGHINTTYKLTFTNGDTKNYYVLQKINTFVFKNPEGLMNNISLVTEYITNVMTARGENPDGKVLHFIKTTDGAFLYTAPDGSAWRAYIFVDGATAYNKIEDPRHFYEAGRGFGQFQRDLACFNAEQLVETIPNFHNTAARYRTFLESVAKDPVGRVAELSEEIAFVNARADMMSDIVNKLASGELPLRVTHNDTKLNNVLIDNITNEALCIIDLDTVMPGSSLYDFGDAIRYGACTTAEDEPDTSKIGVDMELFRQFTRGFVSATEKDLTREEIMLFPLGVIVMTCELVVRFLTDYIDGDKYFKTAYPGHNLVRTRAQMKLLTEFEAHYDEMCDFIKEMLA